MKKAFIVVAMAAAMISCGNNENKSAENKSAENAGTNQGASNTQDISNNPDYKKGLALIGQSDCLTCHKVSEKVVGPSYHDVAERYAGKPGIEDSLAGKIIHGGAGNWGQVPMTPHPNLSHDDAVAMVKYILLLKQQ